MVVEPSKGEVKRTDAVLSLVDIEGYMQGLSFTCDTRWRRAKERTERSRMRRALDSVTRDREHTAGQNAQRSGLTGTQIARYRP